MSDHAMSFGQKVVKELKAIGVTALYFGGWIAGMVLLKQLILAEYQIEFSGLSMAVIGALILSKVVLILEHVSLGSWVRRQPAWVDVVLRTVLYAFGVLVVLVIEKGLEGRHEHGGFTAALVAEIQEADAYHVWVNTICLSGALLVYNAASVARVYLGSGGLLGLFLAPIPDRPGTGPSGSSTT